MSSFFSNFFQFFRLILDAGFIQILYSCSPSHLDVVWPFAVKLLKTLCIFHNQTQQLKMYWIQDRPIENTLSLRKKILQDLKIWTSFISLEMFLQGHYCV